MARTIHELTALGKGYLERGVGDWGLVLLLVLLSAASFGLGRLSVLESSRPPVSIGKMPAAVAPRGIYPGGMYVASRSGSAYYYPWCAGALKILPQNQRWFPDEESARQAGYAPAKNCKGLLE